MIYNFCGRFCGAINQTLTEPLADITVRLYKHRDLQYVSSLAMPDPRQTMMILAADAIAAKASALLAETKMDQDGHFDFALDGQLYKGEAIEIDLLVTSVPGHKPQVSQPPLHLSLTTMKPRWQRTDSGYTAEWEYCLPADIWCDLRARFDAWLIYGRVIAQKTQQPVPGVCVTAFDADWIQDDELGSALTDAEGKFRINYARADFTRTLLSPLINLEEGGPDLYFTLTTERGTALLTEPKTQGMQPGRKNAGHCFFIEFTVQPWPSAMEERDPSLMSKSN